MLLSDICEIIMGQSPSSDSYNVKGQGLPFFQGNADFGKLYPSVRLWCNCPIKKAEAGDLLVSVRAPIGAVNLANQKCCIGRGLAALRPYRDKCDAMYLYYLIKAGKNKLNWLGTGSTFKAITRSSLLSFNVPDYCIAFQRKISGKLWSVDKLIHQRNEQLKLFDLLIQSRFLERFGDPIINPFGYPIHKLGDYIENLTSGARGWARYYADDGNAWFITIKNVKNCKITVDNMQTINAPDNAEAKRTRVKEGDLLISITADLGRTGVVTKEIANKGSYINQHLSCIRLNRYALEPLYVAYFMESEAGKRQFKKENQSAVKAGINFKSIQSLKLMVPPLVRQEEFLSFYKQVDKSKMAVQKSLDELEILKKSLMQTYFG